MKTLALAIALIVSGCAAPSAASAPSTSAVCAVSWRALQTEGNDAGMRFAELPPGARRAFLAAFNATPPVTHVIADHIYLGLSGGNRSMEFVIIVNGDCVITAAQMPLDILRQLLGTSI